MADRPTRGHSSRRHAPDGPTAGRHPSRARSLRRRPPSPARATAAALSLAALALVGVAGCGSSTADDPDAAAQTAPSPTTPAPTEAATTWPDATDLTAFTAIDRATWTTIAADPAAAAGQQILVYGVVERYFTSTGPGVLQASVTTAQPADAVEGTAAILRAQPDTLADVEVGDVIKVYAQVLGAFGGSSGATARTPELAAAAVEEVGPRDLAADVRIGAAVPGSGVTIPVTITNSADVPMSYRVDIMAASADGARNYGTVSARGDALAPGQAAESAARFTGALPEGVVFTVTAISRTPVTP